MEKNSFRVSDAIPEMPISFEQIVNRTLNRVCAEQKQATRVEEATTEDRRVFRTEKRNKKTKLWINKAFAYSAVAVLAVAILAIGGMVVKNALFGSDNRPNPVSETVPQQPIEGIPAIRYHGMLYRISESGQEYAGEVDESVIQRTTEEPVSMSEWPAKEGQTNFGEISIPYAMTAYGLVVQIDHEWKLFEPLLPDAENGLFDAAYAQALLEQNALDREYARLKYIGEKAPEEVEANEFFIHQRLVRLQMICDTYNSLISVEQTSNSVRLSQIAYAENVSTLYFAFAAPNSIRFDTEPSIRMNGTQYNVIDDTGFFSLQDAQTEHYAFYEIQPGRISGERLITIDFGEARFCFRYDGDKHTITLPKDEAEFATWYATTTQTPMPTPASMPTATPAPTSAPTAAFTPLPASTPKVTPTPTPSEEPNPKHVPMIAYRGEVYGMHAEERPGEPDENAVYGTVTSVISISEIPKSDGQANFGSVGMQFAVTNDGLVVRYGNEWRLFVAIEFGHDA